MLKGRSAGKMRMIRLAGLFAKQSELALQQAVTLREQADLLEEIAHGHDARDVYFIRAGEDGPIKIGVASDVMRRLASLQTANAQPLRVVATIKEAGRDKELELHQQFASSRLCGEWFAPSAELLALIGRLTTGEGDA